MMAGYAPDPRHQVSILHVLLQGPGGAQAARGPPIFDARTMCPRSMCPEEFFCQLPPVLPLPAGPLDYGAVIKTVQEVEAAMGRLELDQSPAAGAPIASRVWKLSQDPQGCHAVQQALEDAGSDDVRMALTQELHGHVWEAMKCRNANHVLQRCITTTRSAALQFIIDEIMKEGAVAVRRAARHQFGCRILQRLLEHCPQSQVECLVELLLEDAVGTAKHTFGNYVMQHVMEHGTPSQRHRLSAQLTEKALPLATDVKGCAQAVLGKALSFGTGDDKTALARALLRCQGVLPNMACSRHGHTVVKLALERLQGQEREEAVAQLEGDAAVLGSSRYGRSVLAHLRQMGQSSGLPLQLQ
mmetsp:Transcript_66805/g.196086  ORF Transcript_66805/g.196086 Transcript_66805/m.196086 type:complete len:357 (-) Transcript_66805:46-1116(-)